MKGRDMTGRNRQQTAQEVAEETEHERVMSEVRQGKSSQLFAQEPLEEVEDETLREATGDAKLDLVSAQIQRMDKQRLEVAASLVNTFNYAIQVQAGRNNWIAEDYQRFILAMRAIDSIGTNAIVAEREKL